MTASWYSLLSLWHKLGTPIILGNTIIALPDLKQAIGLVLNQFSAI